MLTREQYLAWAEALESGKYPQCQLTIAKYDIEGKPVAFCCLGVLAYLENRSHLFYGYLDAITEKNFIDLNDHERKSFPEIATYIREHYVSPLDNTPIDKNPDPH